MMRGKSIRRVEPRPALAKMRRKRSLESWIINLNLSYLAVTMLVSSMCLQASSAFMIDSIDNKMIRPFTLVPKPQYDQHHLLSRHSPRTPKRNPSLDMSKDNHQSSNEESGKDKEIKEQDNDNDVSDEIVQKINAKNKPILNGESSDAFSKQAEKNEELLRRITQLEALAASQAVELRKLRSECSELREAATAFTQVVDLLRQAGLSVDQSSKSERKEKSQNNDGSKNKSSSTSEDQNDDLTEKIKYPAAEIEHFDESEIFGSAPASVTDAADAAGASILAALLGGKQKMLVDVRDAELSRDPDVLVQFIELAILPVAAGLEGMKAQRNRVKIVFPTVSQLMQYRKTMALAAPEVVSLSTLGFDPVERRDNLVVIIAPAPDDEEGLTQMNELLSSNSIRQPIVILNHHMVPLAGPGGEYEPIYHLRLLSVQYMASGETLQGLAAERKDANEEKLQSVSLQKNSTRLKGTNSTVSGSDIQIPEKEDAALAAAMKHAHELGTHHGVTRAMVIRAYPKPWHVFVDTSPDTDADFEVAATFDEYPSSDDINYAIVECLEGSEREDELVAQQMQEAIESGQLNSVSDMLGLSNIEDKTDASEDEEDEDDFYNDWDPWFGTDTV